MESSIDNGSKRAAISRSAKIATLLFACVQRTIATATGWILPDVSVQADAEVESPDVLPIALVVSIWEKLIEHAIDVEPVIEDQWTDGGGDPEPGTHRVTQLQYVDARRIGPQVAGVQEQRRLHATAEGNAQLRAWVQEHVPPADHYVANGQPGTRIEQALSNVLRHQGVLQEATQRVDTAQEEQAIGVGLRARDQMLNYPPAKAHRQGEPLVAQANVAGDAARVAQKIAVHRLKGIDQVSALLRCCFDAARFFRHRGIERDGVHVFYTAGDERAFGGVERVVPPIPSHGNALSEHARQALWHAEQRLLLLVILQIAFQRVLLIVAED